MVRHPTKRDLLTYAEGLVDGNVPASIGRHVARCPMCRDEVQSIRRSLETVSTADALTPSQELSQRIISSARAARPRRTRFQRTLYRGMAIAKGAAFAAGLFVVCAIWFTFAIAGGSSESNARAAVAANAAESNFRVATDEMHRATVEIETLAGAVIAREQRPKSRREWHYARRLINVNAQLSAAQAALERNPSSPRAIQLVDTGLRRQRDALMTLIRERSL